ncbi:hypothetical protein CQW23_23363 [Capsicum baccatum]|uniref:Reverse transcriptase Ty1/copia-type domain-containing protein n=1 Tax=Capsicum baccatum TaxID=33114 RepID=A0A2G2VRS9_CAPBA|nr:hypothetical protein CQW23_23363 [Capsicum baccatum]
MLIDLAVVYGLEIHRMDVKTAFLIGELEEEIYMEQPEGFVVPGKENKSKFDMKDLEVADVILGIRIHRTRQGLALSQSHYIENVLDKFKYMEFSIAKTPLDVSFALQKNEVAQVCIHCDSQAAIGKAGSMMYNGKSCHIRQRHNTVRELLSSEIITVDYVKSKDNMSDPLTKGLSREGVERISKRMGLRPRTSHHGDVKISAIKSLHHLQKCLPGCKSLEDINSNLSVDFLASISNDGVDFCMANILTSIIREERSTSIIGEDRSAERLRD